MRINDNGTDRDMTAAELAAYQAFCDQAAAEEAAAQAARDELAQARAAAIAKLAKLGLTESEIAALLPA